MKKTLFTFLAFGILVSCNNSKPNDESKAAEAATEKQTTEPKNSPESETKKPELTMADLSGHWEQTENIEAGGMKASAKLTIDLNENGTYKASQSTMGIASNSSGNWSLSGNTIDLGGLATLIYHEDIQTLVDAKQNISLVKK